MSDNQDPRRADGSSQDPPHTQGSGEGSDSALTAMLKKRREGEHGSVEFEEQDKDQPAND